MGLIAINKFDIDENKCVVSAVTHNEIIRLYYSVQDSPQALLNLLHKSVSQYMAAAIVKKAGLSSETSPSYLAEKLPGVDLKVKHPVDGTERTLKDVIISLNDTSSWSREQIADWIESTCDSKDIAFPNNFGEVSNEIKLLSTTTVVVKIERILPLSTEE